MSVCGLGRFHRATLGSRVWHTVAPGSRDRRRTVTLQTTAQCSPGVHTFYASDMDARAIAHAKSRDGLFYLAEKCAACSGWRLRRVS
jgi:hypothetical protein